MYTLWRAGHNDVNHILEFSYDKLLFDKSGEKFYRLHRDDDEPSLVWSDGSKYWFKEGELHRENGPAAINGQIMRWHVKGVIHRVDGPAIIDQQHYHVGASPMISAWWVHGRHIQNEEIDRIIKHHEINPDWTQWTEGEKLMMRFALS